MELGTVLTALLDQAEIPLAYCGFKLYCMITTPRPPRMIAFGMIKFGIRINHVHALLGLI